MSWTYNGETIKNITDFPPNTYGFVYKVLHKPSNKIYLGKKILFFTRKVKLGKKELEALGKVIGRKPSYKLAVKESDWGTYHGSQKDIKELLKEGKASDWERTIIKCVPSKKLLTYFETKYQMIYQVLEKPDEFFNDNILGKFFTKDFNEIKEYESPNEIVEQ
jgi:hypothetical protein|tara:strand:+ start:7111 stop:7599 length:489 start_codon:yes stop_codon:yes gene_type:complete